MNKLSITIEPDDIVREICSRNDFDFAGTTTFDVPDVRFPTEYGIGLIVGPSGSGKSTLLNTMRITSEPQWDPNKAISSHFASANEASNKLSAVGLNSLPVWVKPYHVLSTGEKFRATMARQLNDRAVIDEFTSVVDRTVAKSCAYAIRRYVDRHNLKNITFATCHYDIVDWLQPDWIYDTATGILDTGRNHDKKPIITIEVQPASRESWAYFRDHHYLTANLSNSSRCWVATWEGVLVGFAAAIAFPSGAIRNGWRGHRTVILPEYQGLGLGVRLSDTIAKMFVESGCRYFSKTAHPRMGEYRENSPHWRPTSHNKQNRIDYEKDCNLDNKKYSKETLLAHKDRTCYCHEYIINKND